MGRRVRQGENYHDLMLVGSVAPLRLTRALFLMMRGLGVRKASITGVRYSPTKVRAHIPLNS